MKKYKASIVIFSCIFSLIAGCAITHPVLPYEGEVSTNTASMQQEEPSDVPTPPSEEQESQFVWKIGIYGNHYMQLIKWDTEEQIWLVFNNKNEIVHHATDKRTTVEELEENLLCIFFRASYDYRFYLFYNPIEDRFSEQYEEILWSEYGLVAYMDIAEKKKNGNTLKLVIRDIFDEAVFYAEFFRDFTDADNSRHAVKDFKFIDENTVYITYYCGEYEGYVRPDPDSETRTETIRFRDPATGHSLSEGKSS